MENQTIFKTNVFGGFGKQEVLAYIEELNKQSKQIEDDLNTKINELLEEQDKLRKDAEQFGEKIENLESSLSDKENKISSLNSLINGLNLEIEKQKRIITEKNNIIDIQTKKAEEWEHKHNEQYQVSSCKVGEVLLKAQATADQIVDKATKDASELTEKSYKYAEDVIRKINSFKSNFVDMRDQINKILSQINSGLDDIESSISTTLVLSDKNKQK